MRWGGIVHFISETVLTGFKIGAGIVIAVSQLPLLLGLAGGGTDLRARSRTSRATSAHCTCRRSRSASPRWRCSSPATCCGRAGRFR